MGISLSSREHGFLGACERWPDSVLGTDGLICDIAAAKLDRIADKLLGCGRGRRPRGLRQSAPKAEVLSSSIVEDLAGSPRGWMYQHR